MLVSNIKYINNKIINYIYFIINIDSFKCKLSKNEYKFLNSASDYTLILSGDCLILFEHIEEQKAKIIFWCSFYAITDIQIIQSLKSATINFYEDKENKDFKLKLYIENIVLFRDTLITKMKALEIKVSVKIIDSNSEKNEKKRLTIKDMTRMKLVDLEQNVKDLKSSIDKGEIDEYSINTFTTLCGRVIEELNKSFDEEDEEKQKVYVNMMKEVFKLEKVEELNNNNLKDKNKEKEKEKEKDKDKEGNENENKNEEEKNKVELEENKNIIIENNKENEDKNEEVKEDENKINNEN